MNIPRLFTYTIGIQSLAWTGTIRGTLPRYMLDESRVCAGLRVSGKALVLGTDTLNKSGAFLYLLIHYEASLM